MPKRAKSESDVREKEPKLEDRLIENMIKIQKVHTDLAEKFDKLTKEISALLKLFEATAASFSKNPALKISESDKKFLEKIDKLLEQNKTIAKGLALMEEQMRSKIYEEPEQIQQKEEVQEYSPSINNNRPLPRF